MYIYIQNTYKYNTYKFTITRWLTEYLNLLFVFDRVQL